MGQKSFPIYFGGGSQNTGKMANSPVFSVIIPCYNEGENIVRTLQSLEQQTFKDFEVIVINDCSIDNTAQEIKDFQKKTKLKLQLIDKKCNEGRPTAINSGLKIAKGTFVAVTDGDCIASKNWLYQIKKEFEKNPAVAAVGGVYESLSRDPVSLAGNMFERIFMDFKLIPNVLPGANSAYKKEKLLAIGGYSTRKWGADICTGLLLKEKKEKVKISPEIIIKTKYPNTAKSILKRKFYWGGGLANTADKMKFKLGFFIRPAYFTLFILSILFTTISAFISQKLLIAGLISTVALFFIPNLIIIALSVIWTMSNKKYQYLNSLPLLLFLPFIQEFSYFAGFIYVLIGRKLDNAWR